MTRLLFFKFFLMSHKDFQTKSSNVSSNNTKRKTVNLTLPTRIIEFWESLKHLLWGRYPYPYPNNNTHVHIWIFISNSVVVQSLSCDPMDCSTSDFPVLYHLSELAQTHVYRVSDAIQPSHPLLSPSPPDFNLSQHQGLFYWVGSLYQVAKVMELQPQQWSFQWIFRIDFLWAWLVWSPCYPSDSQESSPAPQFNTPCVFIHTCI